jgi:hypothetical protein
MAINPTVAASEYAVANSNAVTVSRPGAADASNTLLICAYAAITDTLVFPALTGWTSIKASAFNRVTTYGHYVTVGLLAKLGSASEAATYTFTATGATAADSAISATVYRITEPASTTTLASCFGANATSASATSSLTWPALSLQASDSLLISAGLMLAATQGNAQTLNTRSGSTSIVSHTQATTGTTVYWMGAQHGYFADKSATLGSSADSLSGNYGANALILEVKGGASGGGGRVIVVGL